MTSAGQMRERNLVQTFVRLADSLVTGFDMVELLEGLVESCVELLDVAAAGLVLSDQRGGLRVLAASSEQTRMVELFEVQSGEGPCRDAYVLGVPIASVTSADQAKRWPAFAGKITDAGFGAVYAMPLRLRDQTIGAVNLFCRQDAHLSQEVLEVGQALADVATIALLQHRAIHAGELVAEQLQVALNSRVVIEQAKGMLAQYSRLDMDDAFAALRAYARRTQQPLTLVAQLLASGTLTPGDVATAR